MPKTELVTMSIVVNGQTLSEYKHENNIYVESDLHASNSYEIEETEGGIIQKYPVTPYSIHVTHTSPVPIFVGVYVDGDQIRKCPWFTKGKTMVTDCVKVGQELRELTFTLPRMLENQEKKKENHDLGIIKTVFWKAIPGTAEYVNCTRIIRNNNKDLPQTGGIYHATKKDCNQGPRGVIGATTRDGRVYGRMHVDPQKQYLRVRNSVGPYIDSLTVHYRPRHVLEEMGILERPPAKIDSTEEMSCQMPDSEPQTTIAAPTAITDTKVQMNSSQLTDSQLKATAAARAVADSLKLQVKSPSQLTDSQRKATEVARAIADSLKMQVNSPSQCKGAQLNTTEVAKAISDSFKMQVNSPSQCKGNQLKNISDSLKMQVHSPSQCKMFTNEVASTECTMKSEHKTPDPAEFLEIMEMDEKEDISLDDSVILIGEYIPIKNQNMNTFKRTQRKLKQEEYDLDDSVICLGECPLEELAQMELSNPVRGEINGDSHCYMFDISRVKKEPGMGDESIIFLGDDSCYECDVTPMEIPEIDLTDD